MDIEQLLIGIILILTGTIISILLIRDYESKDFELTRNTLGLGFAALLGILGGLYFVVKSF